MGEKDLAQTLKFIEMVASKQGWVSTKDPDFLGDLAQGLRTNWSRYGYFLCPCRDTEGSREEDKDVVCPCAYAKTDIERYGHCFCSLYWSRDFAESSRQPTGIPERRGREQS
jgi:ferredoxin-thioredoxin reductase catalytic subunit